MRERKETAGRSLTGFSKICNTSTETLQHLKMVVLAWTYFSNRLCLLDLSPAIFYIQWRSQSSGNEGEKPWMGRRPPGRVGPLPKMKKLVVFRSLYFQGERPRLSHLEPRIDLLRLKIGPCRSTMGTPKHVNCLFLLHFDRERLQ